MLAAAMLALSLMQGGQLPPPAEVARPAPSREQLEQFLRQAEVVDRRPLRAGVTLSHRLTLSDGERTRWAVWKTIDEYQPFKRFYDGGLPELGFRDSYKSEIAAYELDKLLALDMVPPTVERRVDRQRGSLQLWIYGCMSEADRVRRGLAPPDEEAWEAQVYRYRVFHQLIHDNDYLNMSNLLVEMNSYRIWVIDQSRAFRTDGRLLETDYLRRFSRPLLARLRALDEAELKEALGRWLSRAQLDGLLRRRDLIVAHADRLIAERGEAAVLY